jgi:2-furoyl-CoA dehydrogenase FAD binding subunit
MKPPRFDYVSAASAEEAVEGLAEAGGEASVLAGGQSLLPMLNMRLARPRVLVDIMHVAPWREIALEGGWIRIGAAVRQVELETFPDLARRQPLLASALPFLAHPQIRNRGTVCGSIAHADPSAELPLAMVALEGVVRLRSRRGVREVAAAPFFTGAMTTEREEDELIESVSVPAARPGTGYAFREVARRQGDFAIVACAAIVDGERARLGVGGVAERPMARDLPPPGSRELDAALDAFAWDLEARDDLHATARYRRGLVRRLGRITLEEAARCRV